MKKMSHFNEFRLLCDENIPFKLTELLKIGGFNVQTAIRSSTDKEVIKLANSENRILLTFDKDFGNIILFPPEEFKGIVLIRIRPPVIETVISALLSLFEKVKPYEFNGKLFSLSTKGFRLFKRK